MVKRKRDLRWWNIPPIALADSAISKYVERFCAQEVESGYMPSPTLAELCAVLDLRVALEAQAEIRGRLAPRRRARPVGRVYTDTGTPETRRKLRADVIAQLVAQDKLTHRHEIAANAIERAKAV